MTTLDQLIRLRKHKVMELQKQMAALQAAVQNEHSLLDDLNARALIEETKAEESELGTLGYQNWLRKLDLTREEIDVRLRDLEAQIAQMTRSLAAAFQDLKKIELIRDRKIDEKRKQELATEQALLDEIALRSGGAS